MVDSNQYFDGYIKAVTNPLPELKETFEKEMEFLARLIDKNDHQDFLDVGCGNGRTIFSLVSRIGEYYCYGFDINQRMIDEALKQKSKYDVRNQCGGLEISLWLNFFAGDATHWNTCEAERFDLVYSGYNLIGSVNEDERGNIISNKSYWCARKGQVITTGWKQDDETAKFLEKYYTSIGFKDINVSKEKSIVDGMTFYRVLLDEIVELYRANNLKNIEVHDIGLWNAVVGRK